MITPLKIITMVVSGCFTILHRLFYMFVSQPGHFWLLVADAENICFPTGRFRPKQPLMCNAKLRIDNATEIVCSVLAQFLLWVQAIGFWAMEAPSA
jgi:hypothetical protein